MPANRRDFAAEVEGIVYLDSSFVIAFLGRSEPYHTACVAFMNRLESHRALPVVSDFVHEEVAFQHLRLALGDIGRTRGVSWRRIPQEDPASFDRALAEVEDRQSRVDSLTVCLPLLDSVRPRAFDLMRRFRLLPADAYHIAVALEHEVESIVTLDADFLQVDGIQVYTCVHAT